MDIRQHLKKGHVIPAHPLALNAERKLDERRQRALTRYYLAAGAGGIAVGVHTTQFAIREPRSGKGIDAVLAVRHLGCHNAASRSRLHPNTAPKPAINFTSPSSFTRPS